MKFQALLYVLAALVAATFAITSITEVKNNLQSLETQTRALDNVIKQLRASDDASVVQTDLANLVKAVDQATSKAKDIKKPFTESDAQIIVAILESLKSVVLNILNDLGVKKEILIGLGLRNVVLQILKKLKSSISGFEDALITAAPADLKSQITDIRNILNSGFDLAISVIGEL